ncbi:nucleoside-triphosphatase [Lacinutrix himadriensis]|uniref:nucleoside-triphosphatase n=1 Tax=Lacinutrix himadriensis TaxID=641549 RepID=UPI0006E27FB6|nr:nucleoside-triphosphatase [Lacinutrix himadriensis]
MIYILTGAIRTGKTTALFDWINDRDDVDGLLCPDSENGKRYFLKVKSRNELELEVETESEDVIAIGSFKFLKAAFKEANDYLISTASETENRYLIIDELGKLELKKEGLHRSAEALVSRFKNDNSQHLILVVRDCLLGAVLEHYAIAEYSLLEKGDIEWFE